MNTRILFEELLFEVDKKEAIVSKLGFTPKIADQLVNLCGGLSIWMGNKLPTYQSDILKGWNDTKPYTKEDLIKKINERKEGLSSNWIQGITSIMDWIRVGLNGNLGQYKELSFIELKNESEEWHKSLGISNENINYIEENDIIRDYRKDGVGFYWVNLNTNDSPEECNRMGHCGRTSSDNTIISLRENKKINDKYTINKSFLTAAIGDEDGIIYQMKGPKNSKPTQQLFPYIVDLILNDENIKGFGTEYKGENDFNIGDLPENEVRMIYEKRPELFNTRKLKRVLIRLNIIPDTLPNMVFDWKLDPSDIHHYIDGDWKVGKDSTVFETLLNGSSFDLWEPSGYDGDWEMAIQYCLDKTNEKTLWKMVNKISKKKGIDITGMDLEESINEIDNSDIQNAISWSVSDAESNSYFNHCFDTLESALEEYGPVIKMDDEGVIIKVDLNKIIEKSDISEDTLDEYMENCEDKVECVLGEILGEYYDKPKYSVDDRWTPDIDNKLFNEMLVDKLSDITV